MWTPILTRLGITDGEAVSVLLKSLRALHAHKSLSRIQGLVVGRHCCLQFAGRKSKDQYFANSLGDAIWGRLWDPYEHTYTYAPVTMEMCTTMS